MAVFSTNGITYKVHISPGTPKHTGWKAPCSEFYGPVAQTYRPARSPLFLPPPITHLLEGPESSMILDLHNCGPSAVSHRMLLFHYLFITVNIYCLLCARHHSKSFMIIKTH